MTHAQLIAAMLETAYPVVKAYHGDLRHDAKLIADADDAAFLWAPIANGSRIIVLRRGEKPNTRAAEIWGAMDRADAADHWYLIRLAPGVADLEKLLRVDAGELAKSAWRQSLTRPHISELNM